MVELRKGEAGVATLLFLAAAALLAGGIFFSYQMGLRVIRHNREMTAHLFVISHLSNFFSALKDTETSQRGFLLTGDPYYLQSYRQELVQLQTEEAGLRRLGATGDLPGDNVDRVMALTQKMLSELDQTVQMRRQGLKAVLPVVRANLGKQLTDEIGAEIRQMQAGEHKEFDEAARLAHQAAILCTATIVGVGTVNLLFLGWAFRKLSREAHRREEAFLEVHQQKELLHTTLASIGDAVIVTDTTGRVTFLNGEAERLTGWKLAEASEQLLPAVFRIIHEKTRQPAENPVEKVLRMGRVVGLANHTILLAKDGQEIPIDDSAAPIRDASAALFGVILVFRDFTERRKALETAARLSAIVENTGDAIISKNLEGIVQTWNFGAERLLGYRPEDIIGKSIRVIIPPDRQAEEDEILGRIRNGKVMERLETIRQAKDGRHIHVSITISPLKDPDGQIIGASKIMRDISDIAAAQEALAQEKELLSVTLASIGDAVIVTDADGHITSLNREAEQLTGWRTLEAQGRSLPDVFKIVNETTRQSVENPVDKVLRLGMVVGLANHTTLISKDGRETPIDDSAAPIRRPAGPLFGVVLIFRDFTKTREAQQQLESELAATRLLQRLSAELIHESNFQALYDEIVDVAMKIMRSDFASFQMFHPERGNGGELRLLAFREFSPEAAALWEWVGAKSKGTVCGKVMRTAERLIIKDVEESDYMRGTEDLAMFRQTGIRSVQSTPLISRDGKNDFNALADSTRAAGT